MRVKDRRGAADKELTTEMSDLTSKSKVWGRWECPGKGLHDSRGLWRQGEARTVGLSYGPWGQGRWNKQPPLERTLGEVRSPGKFSAL